MKIHPKNSQKTPLEKSNINLFKIPKLSRQTDTQISVLFAARTAGIHPPQKHELSAGDARLRARQCSFAFDICAQSIALLYPVFAVKILLFSSLLFCPPKNLILTCRPAFCL